MSEKVVSQTDKKSSVEEYVLSERRNASRNEFMDGRVLPKPASNRFHNLIATNATIAIGSRLTGHKCDIYVNDMRVLLNQKRICYPDVVIVSGEPAFTDRSQEILINPTVVVDVFSSETNSTLKNEKLESYLAMESIRECLLVKEDEMRVEHFFKQNAKQWIYRIYNERDDVISIESINCKLSLAELYAQIKFREAEISSRAVN